MDSDTQQTPFGPLPSSLSGGRLADLCLDDGVQTGPFGSQLHKEDYIPIGTPIITVEHLGENRIIHQDLPRVSDEDRQRLAKYSLKTGDIVFSRVGSVDRRAIVRESENGWLFSGRCLRVRPDPEKLDSQWLSYFFGLPAFKQYIRGIAVGATMPSINTKILSNVPVYFPALTEQRSAAKCLTSIDDKIDLNRRINQTLEAMAQAIFKSWFVDFDPVKAKIAAIQEGRDPLRAAMSAICGKPDAELNTLPPEQYEQLSATAALFPDELKKSEVGEIPKGWVLNQISQFGNVVCGKTPSKANPEYFGAGIPFIKIPDMHNSVYVINPSEQLTALGAASQSKKTIPAGSICVSCIATVGKVVITHEPSQTNQQINSIVPNFSQHSTYLYFQMKEKEKEFHDLASGGSATLNMNTSTFAKVRILTPNLEILTKFSALVAPLFNEILLKQKESVTLSETRDTLLPKLLSGEIPVGDAGNRLMETKVC